MRALVIASVLTALAAAPAAASTIRGKVNVAGGSCAGVKLVPRTPESEREIIALFGSIEPSVRTGTRNAFDNSATSGNGLGREVSCSGWTQGYRFMDVKPGHYFVTVLVRGQRPAKRQTAHFNQSVTGDDLQRQVTYLMQPVRVTAAGQTVQLDFKHD